jgi:hypothetical protein
MSFCAHKGRHRRREASVPTFPPHPQEMLLSLEHIPKFKAITKHEEQPCCASFENTKLERVACSATAAKQTKKYGEPACSPYFPRGSVSQSAMGVSRDWGYDDTGGTVGRVDSRPGERKCVGCCG